MRLYTIACCIIYCALSSLLSPTRSFLTGLSLTPNHHDHRPQHRVVGRRLDDAPSTTTTTTVRLHSTAIDTENQLGQLASMTVLSVDTGDLTVIEDLARTGMITDATTNPLFVSQAGLSGDPRYMAMVDEAIAYAKKNTPTGVDNKNNAVVELAMDRLAVNLGREISALVPGYVSTEVDIRLSFDKEESLKRARRIIDMYEKEGVSRKRILIKLAGTWEGIKCAEQLEKEGITCNITLIFGFIQAVAAAQYGARLISPFPGRILDWHKVIDKKDVYDPSADPGVVEVTRIYSYYKSYGHDTICMPASWRPSRGSGSPEYAADEIRALAGVDRMTIPPPLLKQLADSTDLLPRLLEPHAAAAACNEKEVGGGLIQEKEFRFLLNADGCATQKLGEGIRAFVTDTLKLEAALLSKL